MALIPGGTRSRFGGAPGGVAASSVAPLNGNGDSSHDADNGESSLQDRLKSVVAQPELAPAEPAKTGGLAAFLEAENAYAPTTKDDTDFDDELLRLSHKIHEVFGG